MLNLWGGYFTDNQLIIEYIEVSKKENNYFNGVPSEEGSRKVPTKYGLEVITL